MKSIIIITISILILMIGCPWLAVTFAGTAGMTVCFLLFYAINPLFSIACGVFAGKNIKKLWGFPIFNAYRYKIRAPAAIIKIMQPCRLSAWQILFDCHMLMLARGLPAKS